MTSEKIRKGYRLDSKLVGFMEFYGNQKRWTETTIIEYALEELAKREGYNLDTQSTTHVPTA